jgi:hypothetical protein
MVLSLKSQAELCHPERSGGTCFFGNSWCSQVKIICAAEF